MYPLIYHWFVKSITPLNTRDGSNGIGQLLALTAQSMDHSLSQHHHLQLDMNIRWYSTYSKTWLDNFGVSHIISFNLGIWDSSKASVKTT